MRNLWFFSVLSCFVLVLSGCAGMLGMGGTVAAPALPTTPATPVFFQEWSSALDDAALTTIAAAAKAANAEPGAPITVTGSADSIGSKTANIDLSQTRAQVVADQLATDGVAPSRIGVRAVGSTPAPGMTADMPAQFSRRVLIQIGQ